MTQKINMTRFRQAEYLNTAWQCNAEMGMTPDDLLKPDAWGLVAAQLKPFDTIRVVGDDASWWAEYLVVDSSSLWAKVRLLRQEVFGEIKQSEQSDEPDYKIINRGAKKWSVVRKGDNAVLKDGFPTREEAEKHLDSHLIAMAS